MAQGGVISGIKFMYSYSKNVSMRVQAARISGSSLYQRSCLSSQSQSEFTTGKLRGRSLTLKDQPVPFLELPIQALRLRV